METAKWSSRSVNGVPYKMGDDGKWKIDREAEKQQNEDLAKEEQCKKNLIWIARSRVCTAEEMAEIEQYGPHLFVRMMNAGLSWGFRQEDVDRQFNDLLLHQFRMRLEAEQVKASDK